MGLAERRMIAKLRDETVPRHQSELQKITGTAIAYDVDWDSFAESSAAMDNLEPKALKPISEIFRKICADQLGKDAVSQSIQTIRLSHGKEAKIPDFTLSKGVLKMPWDWEGWPGSFFPDSVREKIESML